MFFPGILLIVHGEVGKHTAELLVFYFPGSKGELDPSPTVT